MCLHEGVGREESAYLGVIQPRVGVNRLYAVVMLVAREATVESEPDLGLLGVPSSVAHAVAPGVEMGLLHGVLVLVQHHIPVPEMVGDHVVEAVYRFQIFPVFLS